MEKQELNNILLKDLSLYDKRAKYTLTLKRYNITTVEQILNDELMTPILRRMNMESRLPLCTFISLLKCRYLDIPIDVDDILNSKINIKFNNSLNRDYFVLYSENGKCHQFSLTGFLGFVDEENDLRLIKLINQSIKNRMDNFDFRVIDLFRWLIDKHGFEIKYLASITTYLRSYEMDKEVLKWKLEEDAIKGLENKKMKLIKKREKLDIAILNMQNEIDERTKQLELKKH
jgi:hypothetical protein